MNKKLHIVCFDVPHPPNYGGVMDVYYKLQALAQNKVEIYLHVFVYGREKQSKLKEYCKEVNYYKRNNTPFSALGISPYIVKSRQSAELVKNLKKIDAPILLEGIHCAGILKNNLFQDRKILFRAHNIEHQYYKELSTNEANVLKKLHFHIEALKLKRFERVLNNADIILPLSAHESDYFKSAYNKEKVVWLPAFHPSKSYHKLSKKGYFALFHGNLDVADNMKAAFLLIDIFKTLDYPLVIAGNSSDKKLISKTDQYNHISLISIKDEKHLFELFHRAQLNILYSANKTGVKLKLINALFQSRFVIANQNVINGSGLESLCLIANNKADITNQVLKIIEKDFSEKDAAQRLENLSMYDNQINAKRLIEMI